MDAAATVDDMPSPATAAAAAAAAADHADVDGGGGGSGSDEPDAVTGKDLFGDDSDEDDDDRRPDPAAASYAPHPRPRTLFAPGSHGTAPSACLRPRPSDRAAPREAAADRVVESVELRPLPSLREGEVRT